MFSGAFVPDTILVGDESPAGRVLT